MTDSFDETLRILADRDRRRLLDSLLEHNPQSAASFAVPDDVPSIGAPESEAHIRMHHIHLPMLEEAGLIEWHQDEGEITRGPAFDEVRPLLQRLGEAGDDSMDGSDEL